MLKRQSISLNLTSCRWFVCTLFAVSVLLVTHSSLGAEELSSSNLVVHLDVSRPKKTDLDWVPLLPREIMRQSVLLAAREEFGLITRDEVLGETASEKDPQAMMLECVTRTANGKIQIEVTPVSKPNSQASLSAKCGTTSNGYVAHSVLAKCVEIAEAWSRNELVDSFHDWGQTPRASADIAVTELPEEIESLQETFSEYAQFAALRLIHTHRQQHGESTESLQALIKGYANLGQLCRYHFNGREQVCYARALLYAERLLNKEEESPSALWHRAYARVMAGMDLDAKKDIKKAKKLAKENEIPAWIPILSQYLNQQSIQITKDSAPELEQEHSDQEVVIEVDDDLSAPSWSDIFSNLLGNVPAKLPIKSSTFEESLSAYLNYVLAERVRNIDALSPQFDELIEIQPFCLRAVDGMVDRGQLSNLHTNTLLGPERHSLAINKYFAALPDLPAEVAAVVENYNINSWPDAPLHELAVALQNADEENNSELSWSALAKMTQDIHFVHVYRRAIFMKYNWSVPVEDFLDAAIPTLEGHRYQSVLRALKFDHERQHAEINAIWDDIEFGDLSVTAVLLFDERWWGIDPSITSLRRWAWNRVLQGGDATSHDLTRRVTQLHYDQKSRRIWFAKELQKVNEDSPISAGALVAYDWEQVKQRVPDYFKKFGRNPYFLRRLAERQIKEELFDEAQKTLQSYIEVSPIRWGYEELSEIHRRKGEFDRATHVLEQYLAEGSDYGLSDARIHEKLAKQYIEQELFDKALVHAELSAQTGAAWAMLIAADVRERLRDWYEAESWYQATAERYESRNSLWYWWCRRTGRGDLESARQLATDYYDNLDELLTPFQRIERGLFHYLEGRPVDAIEDLATEFARESNPLAGMHLVLIAYEVGDLANRDKFLEQLPYSWIPALEGVQQRYFELANVLRLHWQEEPTEFDWQSFEHKLSRLKKLHQVHVFYFASKVCEILGDVEQSEKYARLCAVPLDVPLDFNQTLAMVHLHSKGIDPYAGAPPKLDQTLLEDSPYRLYDLAGDLMKEGQESTAIPLLLEYIERTGELNGLRRLARLHLQQGEFEEALPFAERAAARGDITGYRRAFSANDALGRFDVSEKLAIKSAKTIDNNEPEWLLWCIRTGHGDIAASRDLARYYYVKEEPPYDIGDWRPPMYFLLSEEYEEACLRFEEAFQALADPWTGLHLAILQHQKGDIESRNRTLREVAESKDDKRFRTPLHVADKKLVQLFLPCLEEGNSTPPRIEQVDFILDRLAIDAKVDVSYSSAMLYDMLDKESEKLTCLKNCVTPSYVHMVNQALAYRALREEGINPYDLVDGTRDTIK